MLSCRAKEVLKAVDDCREDSDPRFITNAADVKLRSFTTKVCAICCIQTSLWCISQRDRNHCLGLQVHKVDALVSYKAEDDDAY